MIHELEVDGLKAFSRLQVVPLAPITLIFGGNSAGKSSLLQALLLLKQTLDSSRDGTLWTSGDLVDLGGYPNLAHGHDHTRLLRLGLTTSDEHTRNLSGGTRYSTGFLFGPAGADPVSVRRVELGWSREGHAMCVRAEPRQDLTHRHGFPVFEMLSNASSQRAIADWLCAVLGPRLDTPTAWQTCREQAVAKAQLDSRSETWNGFDRATIEMSLSQLGDSLSAGRPTQFACSRWLPRRVAGPVLDQPTAAVAAALDAILEAATNELLLHLEHLSYLGPTREIPGRLFALGPHKLDGQRSGGIARLVEDPGLLASVNAHLERLKSHYELEASRLDPGDPLLEDRGALRLIDHRYPGGLRVNIADVGFGISQILPIVIASVSSPGGTVMIEQPEMHVHPQLQAQLGDVFVAEAPDTQFIIETHSEHLMLRLLSHVRRGLIDPAHLSVLHVGHDHEGAGASVVRLDVDEAGEFVQRWPGGFFTEREDELFDALDA